jgi:hypothetical protein
MVTAVKRLAIVLTALTLILTSTPAEATVKRPTVNELRTYALGYISGKVGTAKAASQFACFDKIIYRESRWKHTAQNGRYYGLGQMANSKARHSGKPYLQVRAAYKYMVHRYDSPCGAWSFWKRNHWY